MRFLKGLGRLAGLALAASLIAGPTFPSIAAAALFGPTFATTNPVQRPLASIRSRLVQIDLSQVASHLVPFGGSTFDQIRRGYTLDGVITIELFPDVVATFHRTNIELIGQTSIAWTGTVGGSSIHVAILLLNGGQITGTVQLGGRYFIISPVTGALHLISEIDREDYPANKNDFQVAAPPPPPPSQPDSAPEIALPEAVTTTMISLLVAYTPAALRENPNVVNQIQLAVAGANTAYKNTQIPIQLRLVTTPFSTGAYSEGADTMAQWNTMLNQVTGIPATAVLANVRTKRNQLKADLVILVVRSSAVACGLGWVVEAPSASSSAYGFSVQAVGCLAGGIVLPHEVGHNMGLRHDRLTDGGTWPNTKYNFGYVNTSARKIDIMAYTSACTRQRIVNCVQVPWFSSSRIRFTGNIVIGIAPGSAGAADATRRLTEVRAGVAAYR
jgi:hypothetical protein